MPLNITRIPSGVGYPVTVTFYAPGSEAAVDADAAVTVGAVHANGSVILAPGTATTHGGTNSGQYTVTIPPQATPAEMVLTFTGTFSAVVRTQIEALSVVGGFFAELNEIRALDGCSSATTYPTTLLIGKREAAEELFEQATGRHWTLKYSRDVLDGDPTYRRAYMPSDQIQLLHLTRRLILNNENPRTLLNVWLDDGSGTNFVAQTDVPGGYKLYPGGEIERLITSVAWPRGISNVAIEYTYGADRPPRDLRDAFLQYVRYLILSSNGRIPPRATSMTTDMGSFTFSLAQGWQRPTGLPEVDAVLNRYGNRIPTVA